jgi:hypothetical protein
VLRNQDLEKTHKETRSRDAASIVAYGRQTRSTPTADPRLCADLHCVHGIRLQNNSIIALSQQSPTEPIEGSSPESTARRVSAHDVNCVPWIGVDDCVLCRGTGAPS